MKIDHIVLMLSDLKSGIGFYEVLLPLIGFTKTRDYVFGNTYDNYIELKQAIDTGHEYRRQASGLNHIGFTADSREALLSIAKSMETAGFDVPELQEFPEGSAIFFKDNDGMRIEVACQKR